jgi:hypothetical protein
MERPERSDPDTVDSARARQTRHASRLGARLVGGALAGALVGLVVGLAVGLTAFDRPIAVAACAIAGVIGLGGLGAFWGGMAGLESPDPGREPSQTDRPLSEPPTRVEHER